jgi:hypothetical protein
VGASTWDDAGRTIDATPRRVCEPHLCGEKLAEHRRPFGRASSAAPKELSGSRLASATQGQLLRVADTRNAATNQLPKIAQGVNFPYGIEVIKMPVNHGA